MLKFSMVVAWSGQDGEFVATSEEFPNLSGLGPTHEAAVTELQEAIEAALEVFREERVLIPEPRIDEGYSGQFRVRMPKSLHARLVRRAAREGVSLNSLVVAVLSEAQGRSASEQPLLQSYRTAFGSAHDAWSRLFSSAVALSPTMSEGKATEVLSSYLVNSTTTGQLWENLCASWDFDKWQQKGAARDHSHWKELKEA